MQKNRYTYELIFIDDGSTDDSWRMIKTLCGENTNIRGIRFRNNAGKSQALDAGFEIALGRVVITMDADLQDSPDEIPDLYNMIKKERYDLVSGWKKVRYDSKFTKNIPSKIFNWAARKTSKIQLNDFNCGLKAYRNEVIKAIKVEGDMHRYIPILAKNAGFTNIGEKVVKHRPRKYGTSKFGIERFSNGLLDLITIWFLSRFASHNPPKYNGYKVYNNEGGQIVPPEDAEIITAIQKTTYENIRFIPDDSLIKIIGKEIDEAFIAAILKKGFHKKVQAKKLKIVFTPLHGTAITLIPELLKKAGYESLHIIKEQATPDGDFPTVSSPNPEEPAVLKMAIDTAKKINADIVIGTDPDSDRLGIAVKNDQGKWTILNGNQTMVLMTAYLLKNTPTPSKKDFVATTIVSTPMLQKIAENYGVDCKISLTGFKWIGKMISDYPSQNFIGGGEESFGYMVGDFVRDKDAMSATLLACEMALDAKEKNSSLYENLLELYEEYGVYVEKLISITKEGKKGAAIIAKKMETLRNTPPEKINDEKVTYCFDYEKGIITNLQTQETKNTGLPKSNVLIFETANGTRIAARPSGTEPKIKFYISCNDTIKNSAVATIAKLESDIENILSELNLEN
uniref:Phosphoglucomutase n=1 Tax=Stylophora pistillata TaxID=50429 RepID=A0A2B4RAC8_STYPI